MACSPPLEVMTDEDYRKVATDTFQGYADANLEGKLLWESIKMDFKNWPKEHWDAINGKTWSEIKRFCIPRGIWIEDYKNDSSQSEIMMKVVFATKYDTELKDWDMDRIKVVENTYGKVSRGIILRIQALWGDLPDEPQTQPALSKPSLYIYRSHQFQKQEPQPFLQQTHQYPGQSSSQQQPFVSQDLYNQQDFCYNPSDPRSTQYPQAQLYEQQQPTYRHQSTYGYQPTPGPQYAQPAPTRISNLASPTSKMTALDVGRYNIRNRRNDHQPAPTRISNLAPPTSKIRKDCKCILERSTALALSTQAPLTQVPPTQAPPTQGPPTSAPLATLASIPLAPTPQTKVLPTQAPSTEAPLAQVHLAQATPVQALLVQVLPASAPSAPNELGCKQVKIVYTVSGQKEIPGLFEKGRPVVQAYNDKDKNLMLTQLPIKLLYDIPKAGNHSFAAYHPHYKEKFNPTQTFAYAAQLGLVAKKGVPPRVVLYLLSHPLQPPFSLLSLTPSEMRAAMSNWQISLILASFLLLADDSPARLTSEASLNLSDAAQTVEFLTDNIALLSKQLEWKITKFGYVICLADTTKALFGCHFFAPLGNPV